MNNTTSIIGSALFFIILIFKYIVSDNLTYVRSDIDNFQYLVRDLDDKQKAANMLARLKKDINKLVNHLNKYKDTDYAEYKEYIEQLTKRIDGVVIHETPENSSYTSYSVNKGDKLVFCVRSKKFKDKMHEKNLLMYVTLHELAHVGTPEFGHTPLFKKVFRFFTNVAINIGIYKKIPFEIDPHEYCGLVITNSVV